MDFPVLIPLTAVVVNLVLTIFVVARGLKSTINRTYFLWGTSIVVWNLGTFMMFLVETPRAAIVWAKFLQFGVIFLPISLLHLAVTVTETHHAKVIRLSYLAGIMFAAANAAGFFVSGVTNVGYAYYSVAGPAFFAFLLLYIYLTSYTIILLSRKLKTSQRFARSRIKSMLIATAILITMGNNDILPIVGIYNYPWGTPVFPLGSLAATFYGLLVGYSVFQHQLLDIRVTVSRYAAYLLRFGFLLTTSLSLLLIATLLAPDHFNAVSFLTCLMVIVASGAMASILFPRLFGSRDQMLERLLLGDRFEYHDQVQNFISSMQWYGDSNHLLDDLDVLLTKVFGVRNYHIILRQESRQDFAVFRTFPPAKDLGYLFLTDYDAVFRYFQETGKEFLFLRSAESARRSSLEAEAYRQVEGFNADLCFPFFFQEAPFGLLLIGNKCKGEPFTGRDIDLLLSLVKNLALIINQLRLQAQVFQQQELDLLGRMSRGMAHDLNNLLTPISTFFQLSMEGVPSEALKEDLLPVANRNVEIIRSYIREALFFSENLRPDFQLGRLDILIARALEVARDSRPNRNVQLVQSWNEELLMEMDEVLIQRMLSNVVANSIDASSPDSVVRVELRKTTRKDENREWLQVRVIDSGTGIREENLERIFTPYFTTKNRGDKSRGFGLGLAICRKIAMLHGGALNISSKLGDGTIVQIDLPSRQVDRPAPAALKH